MSLRPRPGTVTTDLIWWVFESPTRLRVVAYGSLPLAAFVLPLLSGSGLVAALKFAGFQGGIIGVCALTALAIRRLGDL